MGYLFLDHATTLASPTGAAVARPAIASPIVGLTRLQWSVVALASADRLSTLQKPGRFGIACDLLFGRKQRPELADPQLEALRRVAVLLWHDSSLVPPAEHDAFIAAGFSQGQYDLLRARIASQRRRSTARGRR